MNIYTITSTKALNCRTLLIYKPQVDGSQLSIGRMAVWCASFMHYGFLKLIKPQYLWSQCGHFSFDWSFN